MHSLSKMFIAMVLSVYSSVSITKNNVLLKHEIWTPRVRARCSKMCIIALCILRNGYLSNSVKWPGHQRFRIPPPK